uniref:Tc1-like transposase DDE domain-containing protein n=1 Tax=Anguilla anguilla TaxID=7936 RepID=A0A0E9QMW4_ANGAN
MSPDLNPTEHLWKELKLAVGRRHPSNLRKLEQFVQEERAKLPVEKCRNLIQSYRKGLIAVIASKGCATKY